MKFIVKNSLGENIINLMRRVGYHFDGQDKEKSQLSFTHSLGPNFYPRFHIYLKENKGTGDITITLHLDQKRPVYKGTPAHAGEYDGEVVEKEAERIKMFLT